MIQLGYPQLDFVYLEEHPIGSKGFKVPTVVNDSQEASYLYDGNLRNAFQRNETLLRVQLSSPDKKVLFTVYATSKDRANDILSNCARFYEAHYMDEEDEEPDD